MDTLAFTTLLTLDEVRPQLEALVAEHGLVLDFLMHTWNGRMATYNLGHPTQEVVDQRAGGRRYRVIGRLKFKTLASGQLAGVLSPPTTCDPATDAADSAARVAFGQALLDRLGATLQPSGA